MVPEFPCRVVRAVYAGVRLCQSATMIAKQCRSMLFPLILALATALGAAAPARAQTGDFYAGKTLRIIVGLEAGGTVDTLVRAFSVYLRKHIPGNPGIIVQNMPGAGGLGTTNFLNERAAP